MSRRDRRIAIIGAGPGGMCATIKLKEAGFDDITVIEAGSGIGGTWYHNRYPGCAVDVQCDLYSFSFEIKTDWTRPFARQPEILAYLEEVAAEYGVLPHCRFDTRVEAARWDQSAATWTLDLDSGDPVEADVVISAVGMFNELNLPDIEGLDSFEGNRWHSARWDWDHDISGETIGVIGSAASAVQFVPEIVKRAGQVHYFQRSANWVLPKDDDPWTDEQLAEFATNPEVVLERRQMIYDRVNAGMTFADPAIRANREEVGTQAIGEVLDLDVRAKLVPTHPFGCKRPLLSNDYFAAFNRPNLELVTDPIERITRTGIVATDGTERPVDTLILATGFSTTKYLSAIDVTGRDGLHIDQAWADGARAFLGITTAGFPNMFMLYGPNTNNGSIISMIEYQVEHIVAQVERMTREDLAWIDVRPESQDVWNDQVQEAIGGVEVWQASCNGYYRSPGGRVVTQWPYSMDYFRDRVTQPDPADFEAASRSTG